MKKIIFLSGILCCQLGFGMSPLQRAVRAYLENLQNDNFNYDFSPATRWLLEEVVECSDLGHRACSHLRVYLQEYAPLMCQRDAYYVQRPRLCNFFDDLLQDQKFIAGLMREHFFTETEAKMCAEKIAQALDNAHSL